MRSLVGTATPLANYFARRAVFDFFFGAAFLRATGCFFLATFFGARCSMMSTLGRDTAFDGLARRLASCSAIALPRSAGDFTVRAPALSSARNLSAAVPLPPAM